MLMVSSLWFATAFVHSSSCLGDVLFENSSVEQRQLVLAHLAVAIDDSAKTRVRTVNKGDFIAFNRSTC